jgi:GntR family transcriptional repressor for pyruvate dehydrogenase complex
VPVAASRDPAYQQVAEKLRRRILGGELEPGQRLPIERDLAEQLGVSRLTVREGLRLLAAQRLVVTTRGVTGGSFVARPLSSDLGDSLAESLEWLTMADQITVVELLEARELLEVPASGLAAQRRSAEELAALGGALPDGPRDLSPTFESSRSFHVLIVNASGNRLLETMTRPLFVVLQTRFLRDRAPKSFWKRVDEEHRSIYEAIAERDRLAAEYEMREHLKHLQRMYEQIDRHRQS